ncbi:MAG: hypothetical protein P4M11_04270 [Candidatus Pacebacteria bacterium]|nr:hypothetical protein [Candidatus Paceibacterota bacterium]
MADDRLKKIPVIMMSSSEDIEFISKSLSMGAKDYFVKPLRAGVHRDFL